MSERMADEAFDGELSRYERNTGDRTSALGREAARARAEEARLLEVVKKQEERIAALTEHLRVAWEHDAQCGCGECEASSRAAEEAS